MLGLGLAHDVQMGLHARCSCFVLWPVQAMCQNQIVHIEDVQLHASCPAALVQGCQLRVCFIG